MTTSKSKLEVIAPANEPVIITRRLLKAPRELIFTAWTTPEHMKQWLGPKEFEMISCEVDLRVGGSYRYVHRGRDGKEYGFHGTYLEIEPPRRMVCTFVFELFPQNEVVDTLTLEEKEGGTLVTTHSRHPSIEARDGHLAGGMERGMSEGYERLEGLLTKLEKGGTR
ncbi:MAG TPA: SRPBCC family protein [Spirochaetia bacterium]|nr:SRPBCC family protein [Spirochaetia bacterium]